MHIRNEKYQQDGLTYYRMERGMHRVMVAITPVELEQAREVVAMRLRNARARFDHLRRWGLLR